MVDSASMVDSAVTVDSASIVDSAARVDSAVSVVFAAMVDLPSWLILSVRLLCLFFSLLPWMIVHGFCLHGCFCLHD